MNPDVASSSFKADPYPFYAHLRANSPVHRVLLPDKRRAWLVTRYDDVAAVLKEPRFAKDKSNILSPDQMPWVPGFFAPLARNMLDQDPPHHTRLRLLVQKAFTPRLVEQIRTRRAALTGRIL